MQVYNDLSLACHNKLFVILIALDLTAAYDSVLHDTLAQKMLIAGIDGQMTRWIYQFAIMHVRSPLERHPVRSPAS